ncbi:hypothetical protein C5167_032049 [Papaver somniferum]|uniref:Uncharacterized protein n=1 Tax=Papaver somniferum TaxID=3469 RepID=A0A4Y7K653_PAPSO|nr:hypothetical protein C5167_032049 [Papaver somniferum]
MLLYLEETTSIGGRRTGAVQRRELSEKGLLQSLRVSSLELAVGVPPPYPGHNKFPQLKSLAIYC